MHISFITQIASEIQSISVYYRTDFRSWLSIEFGSIGIECENVSPLCDGIFGTDQNMTTYELIGQILLNL